MTVFILYVLAMLINALGVFGAWCTEPEGKLGMILTVLFMFIPGLNWIVALVYIFIMACMMLEPKRIFKKCTKFWKFLFGEDAIID